MATDEEQQLYSEFGEQVDLVTRVRPVEAGRPEQRTCDDKVDDHGLAQPQCDGAENGANAQDNSKLQEWILKGHTAPASPQRQPESCGWRCVVCKYLPR